MESKPELPGTYYGELSPGKQWVWNGTGKPDDSWIANPQNAPAQMATVTGIATLALTPGTWVQGPNQACTSASTPPIGGLQISLDNGANYFTQIGHLSANALTVKANLNEFYFRIFGAPISIKIAFAS